MLSYRHGYHAGNAADVLKHFMLLYVLDYIKKKDKNFIFIDSHAGAGKYSISDPYMQKNKEYLQGIVKIFKINNNDIFLKNYLDLIKSINPNFDLKIYPGSCYLAAKSLRINDKLHFLELHTTEFLNLKKNFEDDSRIIIENEDSYKRLSKLLPPKEKRAVILIDPSYELKDEYNKVSKMLSVCYKKFPLGVYIVWYPILNNKKSESFILNILKENYKNLSHVQMIMDNSNDGMQGSGLFIVNCPWSVEKDIKKSLETIFNYLKKSDDCSKLIFKNNIN
ncbi:MAG: 23S rRNA (adenine(2030)-N(6))-methyltransferase RlmJ [Candidatus Fonsibacter sp.]|nr:23S rRNA (adenine(2030)-N(6))-methyltransferase RlmJ [Candidatus Fonsibacter sp.]